MKIDCEKIRVSVFCHKTRWIEISWVKRTCLPVKLIFQPVMKIGATEGPMSLWRKTYDDSGREDVLS